MAGLRQTTTRSSLTEDHRLERREAERADQQRQAELGATEADQPAQRADQGAAAERRRARFLSAVPSRHAMLPRSAMVKTP